jgi:predicted acetyltransferase
MTMAEEINDFVEHYFPMDIKFDSDHTFDEQYVTLVDGQIVAHLSMLYRVLTSVEGLARETPAIHVALICNAVVKPEWRGSGMMHALKEQAHARAKKMGFPFCVSISRWPVRQERYGYKPALNLHKFATVLELRDDMPWPKGKVKLLEGDRWE